jgi:hypothetical protein
MHPPHGRELPHFAHKPITSSANRHSRNPRNCTAPIHPLLRLKNPTLPAVRHPSQHLYRHAISLHPRRPSTHNPTPRPNHTVAPPILPRLVVNIIFISGSQGSKQHEKQKDTRHSSSCGNPRARVQHSAAAGSTKRAPCRPPTRCDSKRSPSHRSRAAEMDALSRLG